MSVQKKYFDVLGIAPTSDTSTIKKAYRKLAFKYHPDKNKAPNAEAKFIEITEAYEIVTGVKKISTKQTSQKSEEELRAERMNAARARYQRAQQKELEEEAAYFQLLITGKRWRYVKILGIASAILSALLILDYFLPYHSINKTLDYIWLNGNYSIIDLENGSYYFTRSDGVSVANSPEIIYRQTLIFNDLIDIEYKDYAGFPAKIEPAFAIKQMFPFFPLVLLIPLFTYFYKRPNPLFTILNLCSRYVIPVIVLFVLFSNWRIFRIFF